MHQTYTAQPPSVNPPHRGGIFAYRPRLQVHAECIQKDEEREKTERALKKLQGSRARVALT